MLYAFKGGTDGANPTAGLLNMKGTLYGTTRSGGGGKCSTSGASGCGTVYSISTTGKEKVLYHFAGPDGEFPTASLIELKGRLYGTTYWGGGGFGYGTVFSITTSGREHVIHSFQGDPDGAQPDASLIKVKGMLYGTTEYGGAQSYQAGLGTVFSITTRGTEHVIHIFRYGDGEFPTASLINVKGTLYGTTYGGGTHYGGTVFSITTSGTEHVIHSFDGGLAHGPQAGVIDVEGTLYGTTFWAGTYNDGTVFALRL